VREFGDVVVCDSRSPFICVDGSWLVKKAELIRTELTAR
jgi:hypothetical protein